MSRLNKKTKIVQYPEHFPLDITNGLSASQVNERKEAGLTNKKKKVVTKSYLRIFYDNVVNFFNLILIVIAVFMFIAGLGKEITQFSFLVVLIANISIGLYQDIRARKLVDKMKVVSAVKVDVLRDGKIEHIEANQVVYGDIIQLKTGSQLVCDGSIVDGFAEFNESLLTGESVNINKTLNENVYSGSFVTSGHALYRVEHVGKDNYAEKLQQSAKKFKRVKSEILIAIREILKVISFFVAILLIAQIATNFNALKDFKSPEFSEAVGSISGSIVAMIPIGMYLLTSITLAVGVIRLANRKMLTQDMYCIETLARVDTLCLDKTGTLTDGTLRVKKIVSTSDISERDIAKIAATIVHETKDENATAKAISEEYQNLNLLDSYSAIPFSSDRKYSAVMLEDGRSIVMGAREFIPHVNKEVDLLCNEYEKQGLRVLVFTQYTHVVTVDEPLKEGTVIGFIVLEDHIRDDAQPNIQWFKENGVDIRIITGDNPDTAAEVARRAGIEGADKFISLEGMPLEEVRKIVKDYVIFGRVTPEQKETIVETLKDQGHTVAMTGDGVNDILALRVADCSIAMASGSDAAKNVSHLVSLDSSFSALPDVVREGRRVINNLQRSVSIFLVKTVFAIVLTALFLTRILKSGLDGNRYPFEPMNMILWEFLFIGIGSLFLSLQPNDEQIKSQFLVNILFRILPAALVQIGIVIFYYSGLFSPEIAKTLSIICFSLFSYFILIRVCLPYDIYRIFLVVGTGFIGTLCVIADIFMKGESKFGLNYDAIKESKYIWIVVATLFVCIILYSVLSYGASKLHKYIDKKREERKYDHF